MFCQRRGTIGDDARWNGLLKRAENAIKSKYLFARHILLTIDSKFLKNKKKPEEGRFNFAFFSSFKLNLFN